MATGKKERMAELRGRGRPDGAIFRLLARLSIPLLRLSLGVIYLWFGALKIFGVSPVADLVEKAAILLPKHLFVRFVGIMEVAIGSGLLLRAPLRLTLGLYFLQLAGTFRPLFVHPEATFRNGNPLLPTKNGEFILKNLVLLAAGLAIGSTAYRRDEDMEKT